MEALKFADSHNMVAYLEKSTKNADFDEIVDFLNANPIRYALTGIGSGCGPRSQDTILGDRPAQTRFESLSKQSNDPPLSRVNTLGSGEDNMKLNELMEICTRLSERVLALENIKTAQDLEITNLKKRVKSLGAQEDAFKQGRNEIDQDEGISWFQEDAETQGSAPITNVEPVTTASAPITTVGVSTLMKIISEKSKEKSKEKGVSSQTAIRPTRGVLMKEASEIVTRPIVPPQQQLDPKDKGKGIMQEPEKPVKVKGKDQIAFDEEVAPSACVGFGCGIFLILSVVCNLPPLVISQSNNSHVPSESVC
ncbi:hypothetical protein Tco_1555302 [Tanacetum coccineum]